MRSFHGFDPTTTGDVAPGADGGRAAAGGGDGCDSWTIADNLGEERDDVDAVVSELGEDRLELGPAFADKTIEIYDYNPIGDV